MFDARAEQSVLGCILKNNSETYYTISEMINTDTFSEPSYSSIYFLINEIYNEGAEKIDLQLLKSRCRSHGFHIKQKEVDDCIANACERSSITSLAGKIRKLQILRIIQDHLKGKSRQVEDFTGEESVSEILSLADLDFSELLNDEVKETSLSKKARSIIQNVIDNPVQQVGMSSGYPILDACIGGGLRGGSVTVIVARPKVGKSITCNNVSVNVSNRLNIPVLYIDTELREEEQVFRSLSRLSNIEIGQLETGQFSKDNTKRLLVDRALDTFEQCNIHHVEVAGKTIEEQMGIVSRWIRKNIKQQPDGTWEKFLIVYDYLKLPSAKDISTNISETQALGFLTTTLHNIAMRYDCPIWAAGQVNRDGIDKETTDAVAGSDKILHLCTSLVMLKDKSPEEIQMDGEENGNQKFIVLATRYGPGMEYKNYINLAGDRKVAHIRELGTTNFSLLDERNKKDRPALQQ